MNRSRARLYRAAGLLALVAAVGAVCAVPLRHPWMYNGSSSMPVGLYELWPVDRPARPGDTLVICAPDDVARLGAARGYLEPGPCFAHTAPLIKLVAAVTGDVVDLGDRSIAVNGRCLGAGAGTTFAHDSRGGKLPRVRRGRYRLGPHDVWVWAPAERSFDSRYFGPLDVRGATAFASAVFVRPAPAKLGLSSGPCLAAGNADLLRDVPALAETLSDRAVRARGR